MLCGTLMWMKAGDNSGNQTCSYCRLGIYGTDICKGQEVYDCYGKSRSMGSFLSWPRTFGEKYYRRSSLYRLASDGTVKGAGRACLTYCSDRQPYLRIDTHKNNLPMQKVIESFGFKRCGIITVRGGERIAYDYIRSENR